MDVVLANEWKLTGLEPGPSNVLRVAKGKHRGNVGLPEAKFLGDDAVGYASAPPYGAELMPIAVPLDAAGGASGSVSVFDPRLEADSPARSVGGSGSTAGAFVSPPGGGGEADWLPLSVGPRWDTDAAWRSTLPPSLRDAAIPAGTSRAVQPDEPR